MTAEFMTMCYTVKDKWVDKIPAVVHRVDNTLRPQLVFKERNKFFHNILNEYDKISKIPVLLNTSFNIAGKPITNTVKDAMTLFRDTELDKLIINDIYFKKCQKTLL